MSNLLLSRGALPRVLSSSAVHCSKAKPSPLRRFLSAASPPPPTLRAAVEAQQAAAAQKVASGSSAGGGIRARLFGGSSSSSGKGGAAEGLVTGRQLAKALGLAGAVQVKKVGGGGSAPITHPICARPSRSLRS